MIPKVKVEFRITGTKLPPDKISELINILPTRAWRKGDLIQNTKLQRKYHGWCYSSKPDSNLAKSVRNILKALLPQANAITQMCEEYKLFSELSCAIYTVPNQETPEINFDKEIVSGLAKLNATIDIDIILGVEKLIDAQE